MMSDLPIFSSSTQPTSSTEPKKYIKDPRTFVQFRIDINEYPKLLELAKQAFEASQIKAPTISALARASLLTMANLAIKMEAENERNREYDKKRKELQAITPSILYPKTPDLKF
jgi:hypothetical protein